MRFWRSLKNHLVPWRGNAHRPHILRKQWLVAFLGLALISEALILGHASLNYGPNVLLSAVVRSEVFAYTVQARGAQGGAVLTESELLTAAAQAKADDMAARGYFSHVGPQGEQPWVWLERAGYDYVYAGENLAVRFEDSKDVVDAWMESPGHRANIVKSAYTQMGVGLAQGTYKGSSTTFVVQFFASPSATYPQVQAAPVEPPEVQVVEPEAPTRAAVAGAAVAAAPEQSFIQSATRFAASLLAELYSAASWILLGIATLLAIVLMLTFFIKIQVQPTDLLVPGAAVALVAIVLIGANARFLDTRSQTASVASYEQGEVGSAAAVERVQVALP